MLWGDYIEVDIIFSPKTILTCEFLSILNKKKKDSNSQVCMAFLRGLTNTSPKILSEIYNMRMNPLGYV